MHRGVGRGVQGVHVNPLSKLMIFMNQSHLKKNMNRMLSYYSFTY